MLTLTSCSADAGDANGQGKGLPNGANTYCPEAEVRHHPPSTVSSLQLPNFRY
jgi:hypothetical protein